MDFAPLSILPILVFLVCIGIVALIVLMWYLGRTKAATSEARLGQFEIVILPSGDRITGLTTLARSLVKQEFTQVLAQTGQITNDQASTLNKTFDKLFFYAVKGHGRGKFLIVSNESIEDPHFAVPLEQVFELPFGYITRRLVVADGVRTERAGWQVFTINPRRTDVEILGQTYTSMVNIGEAAACVKEAAIRLKNEIPWREVADAQGKQLSEVNNRVAELNYENQELKLALANKPLMEIEVPGQAQATAAGGGWTRIIVTGIAFAATHFGVVPYLMSGADPLPYSIVVALVTLFTWPWIHSKLKKWF